ncbi:DUF4242 domain-containing protein [Phormidium tenue FACHB-886]|nr:DUF4242 domain-containing protein [Phormidium tenue FACHB-886]
MKFAASEMVFTPPLTTPITFDDWMQFTASIDGCLAVRHIQWLYSLVSVQGDRSICLYQTPYTDALRAAFREARFPAQRVWKIPTAPSMPKSPSTNQIVVVESHHSHNTQTDLENPLQSSFTSTIIPTNANQSITLFSATDAAVVQAHYIDTKTPFDRIWAAHIFSA